MKKLFTVVFSAALLASFAGIAGAVNYPPGPGGACVMNPGDSLTINDVQDPLSLCHPASGDSVRGVRGYVTAIDSISTAYGFWIERLTGGAYSGVQVFTGSSNYQASLPGTATGGNVYYGDQVSVSGRAFEFTGGLTEMTDYDNIQGTNDIEVWRVTTHAPNPILPPFHIGTTLELDWVPGWVSVNGTANQEPWEGTLVRVKGPLVVGRTVGNGVGTRSMLLSTAGGADTLAVDGFTLTNVAALTVGALVDSVQGVFHQTQFGSPIVNSYRILFRNTNDLFAAAPPNVIDAYPIADNIIRVIFDRKVTVASAQNTGNYSLASFGSINSAVLEGSGTAVQVNITNGLAHGDGETITVSNVVSTSGLPMSGSQGRSFFNGVLSIAEVQAPAAAGLAGSPCHDYSRMVGINGVTGNRASYTGVVVADYGNLFYISDVGGGPRSGLAIFAPPSPLTVGHKYLIAGAFQEFDGINTTIQAGMTEGVNTQYIQDLGTAAVPAPFKSTIHVLSDTTCDAAQNQINAEDYEGVLVTVDYVRVAENRTAGTGFLIAGPCCTWLPDTMLVSNSNGAFTYAADSLATIKVTGMLNWRNGGFPWRITPRDDNDIVVHGHAVGVDGDSRADVLQLAVSPNPSRSARINFNIPKAGDVDLGIFDLAGRRVTTVMSARVPAGQYSKTWNGTDAAGNIVRSGVYFYRLRLGDQLVTTTAIKLD